MLKQKDISTLKEVLKIYEKRSTCKRLQVAALLVKDGRIISSAYNGTSSNSIHCIDLFSKTSEEVFLSKHHDFSEKYEFHAELNAIALAAKEGISTAGCDIFSSILPCPNCAKLIIASGIKNVYYIEEYDRESFGKKLLEECKVGVYKI